MKIKPAVLSENLNDYKKAFELFESFLGNEWAHIDIMDGIFVESKSANLEEILDIPTTLKRQVHLMVDDPLADMQLCADSGVEQVAFHFESQFKNYSELRQFSDMGIYVAIRPSTDAKDLQKVLKYVDGVHLLTVTPGQQGNPFLRSELDEIDRIKSMSTFEKIVLDGHIDANTISREKILQLPVDDLVVGSAIIKQADPLVSYNRLVELTK